MATARKLGADARKRGAAPREPQAKKRRGDGGSGLATQVARQTASRSVGEGGRKCVHVVCWPEGQYVSPDPSKSQAENEAAMFGKPYTGKMAKGYPFQLDPFQQVSVNCLENRESVMVAAHTSAGKTAVAEYAIAMALRDNQRVIYTSPLKALSNQKYRDLQSEFSDVGLMTGDTTIAPNAPVLVMTTEILRSMLYRGSEVVREVAWVVFDEVHYMKDRERGVVWEESIIFLPSQVKMVFLSATLSNSTQFAQWITSLHHQRCHVVSTDYRPVPLQHYAFPIGGKGLHLLVDEHGNYREQNFYSMRESLGQVAESAKSGKSPGRQDRGRGKPQIQNDPRKDVTRLVKMCDQTKWLPVIVFSFSRRECEQYAGDLSKLDFTSDDEKKLIESVFLNAVQETLSESDQELKAVTMMLPLLKKGVGIHHSGLLPIVKEIVEILFQENLLKVLFATETFAMGINMPAHTVIFTASRKWDGEEHRLMASGEYIQMSGRAGRRGKDDRGICILMIEESLENDQARELLLGKPAPLNSSFKLSYYTLLNLCTRAESLETMETIISKSFKQFQHEQNLPNLEKRLDEIQQKASSIQVVGEEATEEYMRLRNELEKHGNLLNSIILQPENLMNFLRPGRIVRVKEDSGHDWGWGVVVAVVHKQGAIAVGPMIDRYTVDVLLQVDPESLLASAGTKVRPQPPKSGVSGEMHVVPIHPKLIKRVCCMRVSLPQDLKPASMRQSVLLSLKALLDRFPDGLPLLDPVEDMKIDDVRLKTVVREMEDIEAKLAENPVHLAHMRKSDRVEEFDRKAQLLSEASDIKKAMGESQLKAFKEEQKCRSRVLRKLKHIDDKGVVQVKGRAACQIDTGDELLVLELMIDGYFNDLDTHQVLAITSCFVLEEKTSYQYVPAELAKPFADLQQAARTFWQVQKECGVSCEEMEEYVAKLKPDLMSVVYSWSKGSSFNDICHMTDLFEGSIIRVMRRLSELLAQLVGAAKVLGDESLVNKFDQSNEGLCRDIVFANSLYTVSNDDDDLAT